MCPTDIRMQRLQECEARRGWVDEEFIEWASHYDDGTHEGHNLPRHQRRLDALVGPVLRLDGTLSVTELVGHVIAATR
jgi:hypothetical protein